MDQQQMPPKKKEVPDGVWMKCPGCEETVFRKSVEEGFWVCPECNYHFPITAQQRLDLLLDAGTFEEWYADLEPCDPLNFVDLKPYNERLRSYQQESSLRDAVVCGHGRLKNRDVVIAVMDSRFIMASMGSVVGEKITRCAEEALERGWPLIVVCASGGARMQEGLLSLMQMAKTSVAMARLHAAGGLYIAIYTNPTTAGVLASFASQADIVLAEPGALVGFTGPRVIKETIKAELPEGFQTSEFLLEHGFIDRVVARKDLRRELAVIMDYCLGPAPEGNHSPSQ